MQETRYLAKKFNEIKQFGGSEPTFNKIMIIW